MTTDTINPMTGKQYSHLDNLLQKCIAIEVGHATNHVYKFTEMWKVFCVCVRGLRPRFVSKAKVLNHLYREMYKDFDKLNSHLLASVKSIIPNDYYVSVAPKRGMTLKCDPVKLEVRTVKGNHFVGYLQTEMGIKGAALIATTSRQKVTTNVNTSSYTTAIMIKESVNLLVQDYQKALLAKKMYAI